MLAAVSLQLPTIHEQNAILGRANRPPAPLVRRIATGFPDTDRLRRSDRARAVHTENPVRAAILALGSVPYTAPRPDQPIERPDLGGSQGAHILGVVVPAALAMLPQSLRERLRVSQPAPRIARRSSEATRAGDSVRRSSAFFRCPAAACAHLAICRAGASTIGELAAVGRPAVLIPYPFVTTITRPPTPAPLPLPAASAYRSIRVARRASPPISKNC